jgi:hypothetical protein
MAIAKRSKQIKSVSQRPGSSRRARGDCAVSVAGIFLEPVVFFSPEVPLAVLCVWVIIILFLFYSSLKKKQGARTNGAFSFRQGKKIEIN